MNEDNIDKTIKHESLPPVSSGSHVRGEKLLQTGMMRAPASPGLMGQLDRFQIERVLGEGGMGQVLLAREPVTDALVAIKIIKPEFVQENWAIHRFLTEARHMYKMSHPGILRVSEVSDRKEGPYFVMPYLTGGSLAERIKPGEPLPEDTILSVGQSIAGALDYAHGKGIIHRDLKPSNVLFDGEGRAYLTDFGLLRTVFNDSMVDVTKDRIEGTLPYMSPAVAEGKAEDTRCDIYSFGCLLYEMLTGHPPYQGPSVDNVLKQIAVGPPKPIRELNPKAPANLVAIAERAMARELRDRYASMADVTADLERVAKGEAALGPRGQVRLGKRINLRRLAATVAVSLAGVVLAIGLWQVAARSWGSNNSVSGWQATLEKAAKAYDENRFEESVGLFDAALTAMNADQKADPSVRRLAQNKASKDRALAGFILDRSKLPLPQQIELTQQKLAEFNTNYTGKGTFTFTVTVTKEGQIIAELEKTGIANLTPLKGLPLARLSLVGNPVADLSPLRGMKLTGLNLQGTPVTDLAPLTGLPLESLAIRDSKVTDLGPLKGMTSLTALNCRNTRIRDLGPLRGLPLKRLDLSWTDVTDISPLQSMPLEELGISEMPVGDLRPLKGVPLKVLDMNYSRNVTDFSPLKGMPLVGMSAAGVPVTNLSVLRTLKALVDVYGVDPKPLLNDLYTALRTNGLAHAKQEAAALIADCQSVPAFSNVVAEAREIQTSLVKLAEGDTGPYSQYWLKHLKERGVVDNRYYRCDTNGLITLKIWGLLVSSNASLNALHYVPLSDVELQSNNLTNLQALAGLPLKSLNLGRNPVTDLTPLKGMPLKTLNLSQTTVVDLSPLRGMTSLTDLDCGGIPAQDLSPLRGIPLKSLCIVGIRVSDLTILKGMPLVSLSAGDWGNAAADLTDLSPLEGMSLTDLFLPNSGITDLSPLAGMPLEALTLKGSKNLSNLAALRGMKLTFLRVGETRVADVTVLQGMPLKELWLDSSKVVAFPPFDGMPIGKLVINSTLATNLPSLKGAPLRILEMNSTRISDLTPLAGLPLFDLSLADSPVADLSPLRGAPLERLDASRTRIADLAPLKGMPLSKISIGGTPVRDLSPLQGMKSLMAIEGIDVAALLLMDVRRAVEVKDNATVTTLATKIIAHWQDVPAMTDVVKQAKEMLNTMALVSVAGIGNSAFAAGVVIPKPFNLTPEWSAQIEKIAPEKTDAAPQAKRQALLFSRMTGFQHWVTPHTAEVIRILCRKSGACDVVETNDVSIFEPDAIKRFDVIILNNNCSDDKRRNLFLDVTQDEKKAEMLEQSLLAHIASGKGLVAIHGTIVMQNQSPEFGRMLGGSFDFHPVQQEVTCLPVEPVHPLVAAFGGKPFTHVDEPYLFTGAYRDKNFRPLLRMDVSRLECGGKEDLVRSDVRYVAWIKKYGRGRVFYCSPSHNAQSFERPELLRFLSDGIQYAVGDLACDDSPLPPAAGR